MLNADQVFSLGDFKWDSPDKSNDLTKPYCVEAMNGRAANKQLLQDPNTQTAVPQLTVLVIYSVSAFKKGFQNTKKKMYHLL